MHLSILILSLSVFLRVREQLNSFYIIFRDISTTREDADCQLIQDPAWS